MTEFESLSTDQLVTATGGAALPSLGNIWDRIKPHLPPNGPTIPLGPFYPPKPSDSRIA